MIGINRRCGLNDDCSHLKRISSDKVYELNFSENYVPMVGFSAADSLKDDSISKIKITTVEYEQSNQQRCRTLLKTWTDSTPEKGQRSTHTFLL